jgi:hypothetical protein
MLAERAQKLAEIESRASESRLAAVSMPLVEKAPRTSPVEPATSDLATRPDNSAPITHPSQVTMKEEATVNTPGTPLTQISSNDVLPGAPNRALVRWVALSSAVACAAVAVVVMRQRPQLAPLDPPPEIAAAAQPVLAPIVVMSPPISTVEPAAEGPGNTTSPVVEALASSASGTKKGSKKNEKAAGNKKVDCNPPYTTDENHVRRMKPECK